jgi:hypothetical protein
LAVLLPGLNRARSLAKRLFCQNNLKQITLAWLLYLEDNDGAFYQKVNANHDFGGWKGTGGYALNCNRPLNKYVGLLSESQTGINSKVFRCPADTGGVFGLPDEERAYQYFGNSYQTNILLVGPTQIGFATPTLMPLHEALNTKLKDITLSSVTTHTTLLALVGDNNWMQEWHPLMPDHSKDWHDKARHYNLAFLDGHADLVRVRKGLYVTSEYSIVPFRELNKLAHSVQEEVE